jgi:hypothetical protein
MTDVEEMRPGRRVLNTNHNNTNNPYANLPPPPIQSRYDPINIVQRSFWMLGSSYVLIHHLDVYTRVMTSPKVSHEWFKVGLGATTGKGVVLIVVLVVTTTAFSYQWSIHIYMLFSCCAVW